MIFVDLKENLKSIGSKIGKICENPWLSTAWLSGLTFILSFAFWKMSVGTVNFISIGTLIALFFLLILPPLFSYYSGYAAVKKYQKGMFGAILTAFLVSFLPSLMPTLGVWVEFQTRTLVQGVGGGQGLWIVFTIGLGILFLLSAIVFGAIGARNAEKTMNKP